MRDLLYAPSKVAELALALGCAPINQQPGAWVCDLDEHWRVAVNGHSTPITLPPFESCMGAQLEPYELGIWYNGWLAGVFTPYDGVIAAGEGANEETFIAALDAALEDVQDRALTSSVKWRYVA